MTTEGTPITIDLDAVKNEVANLTKEQLAQAVLDFRTRQKIQQKKQQGKGSQKAYQKKQQEFRKLLKQRAIAEGLYDEINEKADAAAAAALAGAAVVAEADEVEADEEETVATPA